MKSSSKQIKDGWQQLADESVEPFHYERTMARVRGKIERRNPIMFAFKRVALGTGIAVALIVIMIFIPATYSVDVGSIVTAKFAMADEMSFQPIIDATNGIEGAVNRSMNINNGDAELTFALETKSGDKFAKQLKDALLTVVDKPDDLIVSSEKVKKLMGGNALAAVTGGRVRIACDQLNEDQIRERIIAELTARGADVRDVNVSVSKEQNGDEECTRVEIRVEAEPGEDGELPELMELPIDILGEADFKERVIIRKEEIK